MKPSAVPSAATVIRLADLDVLHPSRGWPMVAEPEGGDALRDEPASASARNGEAFAARPRAIGSGEGAFSMAQGHDGGHDGPAGHEGRDAGSCSPADLPCKAVPRLPTGVVLDLPVRCEIEGRRFARIWAGNAVLLLVTLGLAWPWAYRRSRRYFLGQLQVGGHRLAFRLSVPTLWPRLMTGAALLIGTGAALSGPWWAAAAAVTVGLAIWPLLAYVRINQQVSGIGWAGRRLWFDGPWGGLYKAAGPLLVLGGVSAGALAVAASRGGLWWALAAAVGLVSMVQAPRAVWRVLRYRQQHVRLGPLRLRWACTRSQFRTAWTQAWLGGILAALPLAGGAVLVMGGALVLAPASGIPGVWAWLPGGALLLLGGVALQGYVSAAIFNVVWSKTGNRHLRFTCSLQPSAFARLKVRNALRLLLTLGLYWPWAKAACWRMKMHSCVVRSRVDPQLLQAYWSRRQGEAPPTEMPSQPCATSLSSMSTAGAATTQPSVLARRA